MLETFSRNIIEMIDGNLWVGPLFALIAGIFTSLTPCALSNIPLVTGYVTADGDENKDNRRALLLSMTFAAGAAVTFICLGFIASAVGHVIGHSEILHMILGILVILMGLQMWGVIHLIPHVHGLAGNGKQGFVGAFFIGMIGGIFSSHCAAPVILMLLAIAAQSENYLLGAVLLLCYSIGHGIIIAIAGTSVGFANRLDGTAANLTSKVFKGVLGALMLLIGIYMLIGD